jgi:hypothetical protein
MAGNWLFAGGGLVLVLLEPCLGEWIGIKNELNCEEN